MDGGKVDDVTGIRDRIKNQGPRYRPALDLKFITFGFAYLQDMVEHAIVEEQVLTAGGPLDGFDVPPLPGLMLQQFPYPCFIQDRYEDLIASFHSCMLHHTSFSNVTASFIDVICHE
jgi:hypothetical protein